MGAMFPRQTAVDRAEKRRAGLIPSTEAIGGGFKQPGFTLPGFNWV